MTEGRRSPPPWTVEEYRGIAYIVRDANRACLLRVRDWTTRYLMTKDEARTIAASIAKLPEQFKRPPQ